MSLDVKVANALGDPLLFTGSGAANQLVVTLQNTGTSPVKLRAAPAEPVTASASYTTVSIGLGKLVPAAGAAGLAVSGSDGTHAAWHKTFDGKVWCLAPSQDVVLDHLDSVSITLGSWPPFAATTHGQLETDWANAGGVADDGLPFTIMVVNPPGAAGRPLADDLSMSLDVDELYTTGETSPNVVRLRLVNLRRAPLVPAGTPAASGPPTFTLMFACGDTPTAQTLTTCSHAQDTVVVPAPGYEQQWKADPIDDQVRPPCWRLHPQTAEILAASGGVEFAISPLVVPPPVGWGLIYLMHTGVPGYDDGYQVLQVDKREPASRILRFFATTPDVIEQGDPVSLTWQTFGAKALRLSWPSGAARTRQVRMSPADIALNGGFDPPPPDRDTTYYLEALDENGKKIDDRSQPISVNSRAPVITDLTVAPQVADMAPGPVKVTLSWRASDADSLQFIPYVPLVAGAPAAVTSVHDTTQFVLTATGPGGQWVGEVTVYDYPGFLTGHTFSLATSYPGPPNSPYYMTVYETLTFNDDHSGTYAPSIASNAPMAGGGWMPTLTLTWQLKGDTVTLVGPEQRFAGVVRIAGGQLVYVQSFWMDKELDRHGHAFTARAR